MVSACPVSITNAGERCPPLFGGVCVSVLSSIPGSNFRAVLSGGREVKGIFAPLSKKYSLFFKYFCIGEEFQNNCAFFFKGYASSFLGFLL